MTKTELYRGIVDYFSVAMPAPQSELYYSTPFELLVAVVLSAQCTDKRVNLVTPGLFSALPTPEAMARSTEEEIFEHIRSVSYPNAKARHLHQLAQRLVTDFGGQVPDNRRDLESLAGVGRKTASVILAIIFHQPEMAVDTHVHRVSARIGLTKNAKTPLETEQQLVKGFKAVCPPEILPDAHHWLILHGRYTCTARAPKCTECGIANLCAHYKPPKAAQK